MRQTFRGEYRIHKVLHGGVPLLSVGYASRPYQIWKTYVLIAAGDICMPMGGSADAVNSRWGTSQADSFCLGLAMKDIWPKCSVSGSVLRGSSEGGVVALGRLLLS